jgi:uncharacterized protein DUF6152
MLTRIACFALGALVAGSASAHHSLAIYENETAVLEGEIVDVRWVNPHVEIKLRTTADGKEQVWQLESGSLMTLQRSGVTRESLRESEHVKVSVRMSRRDPLLAAVATMLLPDGRELQLFSGAGPYFTDARRFVRGSDVVASDTARENRGIFRVWSVPSPNSVTAAMLQALPYTAAAVAARAKFDLYDNFATRCEPEGMPRIMFNPHPFEFIDNGATLTLRTELYDTQRIIHMDRAEPPPAEPASRLGYSVGRWDGRALVVTTTGVSWPYFDNAGTPQSSAVRIVERYVPSADQGRLDFEVTVTDPATFTTPAVLKGHWLALGATIPRYDCQRQ